MNYILIMTEGTTELAFLDVLLEKNILKFELQDGDYALLNLNDSE